LCLGYLQMRGTTWNAKLVSQVGALEVSQIGLTLVWHNFVVGTSSLQHHLLSSPSS
jgi:hypothetical protein